MTGPVARPTKPAKPARPQKAGPVRDRRHKAGATGPRAFASEALTDAPSAVQSLTAAPPLAGLITTPASKGGPGFAGRLLLWATGLLLSLGLGLAAEKLIRDLFDRYEILGWAGVGALALLIAALLVLGAREILALRRLANLDALRDRAGEALDTDRPGDGRQVLASLDALYRTRPDMARSRQTLASDVTQLFDGGEMIRSAERTLMTQLDNRARALTAASARRVAIVTAISPRALVDIAFVTYESFRLARAVAALYGARPGLFGYLRLARAVLGHLAVTGGVALGDSLIQQLVGHGLAAKLSARLGEGFVNGLMTVRVGIAAMRVTRPLPFATLGQPTVTDFLPALAEIASLKGEKTK